VLGLILAAALCTTGMLTIDPLFTLLGADPATLPLIRQYMLIWYPGTLFIVIPMVGNHAIRATGDTKYPGMIMMVVAGVNVVLDPLLIFGLAGFPRLELAGAAIATVIARALACAASLSILHFREKMIDFSLPRRREVIESWRQTLRIGAPAALTNLLTPISMGIVTRLTAQFGQTAVAALGAGTRIVPLSMIPVHALAVAIMPFAGQNWGAKCFQRIQDGRRQGYMFTVWWGLLCAAVFLIFGDRIASMFTDDIDVAQQIAVFLYVIPLGFIVQGVFMVSTATLNAINQPMASASLVAIRMLVFFVPLAYAGASVGQLPGLFVGICVADYASAALALFWCNRVCATEISRHQSSESE
jgi:putative MATE family efflux protein